MFDIGLFELLVVGGVGLVVIGPDKLPGAIRTGALWIGRIKRSIGDTRREIEQHIGADEIRRELRNEEIMASLEKLREARTQLEQDIKTHTSGEAIEHKSFDEDYDRSQENHHPEDYVHDDNPHTHDDNTHNEEVHHEQHEIEPSAAPLASNQRTDEADTDSVLIEPEDDHTKEAGTPPSKA